jgi:antitoxin component of MazEF toxin-antitoxin module
MPKLLVISKTKKENHGTFRHDSYNVIIPYKIAQQLNLHDSTALHSTLSEKTGVIRLHTKPLHNSTPIKVRQWFTKIYKSQRYHSTKITIPISFVRELNLKRNDNLDIDCTSNSIKIQKNNKRNSS